MAKRTRTDLRSYAVVGAEQRLLQLAEEAAQIFAIFPELRAPGRGFMAIRQGGARRQGTAGASEPRTRKRRRRKLSPEARKRISDAQKRRWAKQRKSTQS